VSEVQSGKHLDGTLTFLGSLPWRSPIFVPILSALSGHPALEHLSNPLAAGVRQQKVPFHDHAH
jgi:hypothetical protein